jgi:hypothetical protein
MRLMLFLVFLVPLAVEWCYLAQAMPLSWPSFVPLCLGGEKSLSSLPQRLDVRRQLGTLHL